jgi:hypothetical protein
VPHYASKEPRDGEAGVRFDYQFQFSIFNFQFLSQAPRVDFPLSPAPLWRNDVPSRAFSLIEIMVTVGLLTVIILGLLLMFNQTQRAFRAGMTQTDVLEAGRATMDMLARELEQMTPSQYPDRVFSSGIRYRVTNFFAEPSPLFDWRTPLIQELSGNRLSRTNLIPTILLPHKTQPGFAGHGL